MLHARQREGAGHQERTWGERGPGPGSPRGAVAFHPLHLHQVCRRLPVLLTVSGVQCACMLLTLKHTCNMCACFSS